MPFKLINPSVSFQNFIKDTLVPFLVRYVTAYSNDIIFFTNTLDDHQMNVRSVLKTLSKVKLHLKSEKCEFHKEEGKYFGLIIGKVGVIMDPNKVERVQDCLISPRTFDAWLFLLIRQFILTIHT